MQKFIVFFYIIIPNMFSFLHSFINFLFNIPFTLTFRLHPPPTISYPLFLYFYHLYLLHLFILYILYYTIYILLSTNSLNISIKKGNRYIGSLLSYRIMSYFYIFGYKPSSLCC